MKNIRIKCKKIMAIVVLFFIAVCTAAPIAKASLSTEGNRQYSATKGYRSHTKVRAYDDNGYGKRLTVYSKIGSVDAQKRGYGEVIVNTEYISSAKDAYHGYGIGENVTHRWQSN